MSSPIISVLLPCYNAAATLQESLDSVLRQSFTDFEVLVLDDGSTDAPIPPAADPRVRCLRSEQNLGLSRQLNIGLEQARGEFVARLDADDVALPERLFKQLDLMLQHTEIGICGCQAQLFDASGDLEIWDYPTDPALCHSTLFLRSCFLHPGVMMRRSLLEKHGLRYDESLEVAQDYELWYRILKHSSGTNLDSALVRYRVSDAQLSREKHDLKEQETRSIHTSILADLGIGGLDIYERVLAPVWDESREFFSTVADWLNTAFDANEARGIFPRHAFAGMLAELFFHRCQCATRRGFDGATMFRRLKFADRYRATPADLMRLRMKSILKPALPS